MCRGYNADPNSVIWWPLVDTFVRDNNFTVCDLILPIISFTYLIPAHNTTGWLDHIITSKQINISNVKIMYGESIFGHFPPSFYLCLRSGVNILSRSRRKYLIENFVDWKSYCDNILENMSGIEICTDVNCTTDHTVHIDTEYDVLIKSFHISTKEFRINRLQKVKIIPGWNNYCKEKYRLAREAFLTWLIYLKIRSGSIFVDMKATRKDFAQSLRICKSNEKLIRNNNLVNALQSKNMYQFWKEVRNQRKDVQTVNDIIDGNNNDDDIANVFYKKFSVILGTSRKADSSKNSSRRIMFHLAVYNCRSIVFEDFMR